MRKWELQEIILKVLKYKDPGHATGVYHVGSLETQRVCDLLSIGLGNDSIEEAINKSTVKVLKEVYDYLERHIKHMNKYPVDKCPNCHSLQRTAWFNPDTFVIEFADNYIPTLLTYVGLDEAINRLLKEGSVALRDQIKKKVYSTADDMLETIEQFVEDKEKAIG